MFKNYTIKEGCFEDFPAGNRVEEDHRGHCATIPPTMHGSNISSNGHPTSIWKLLLMGRSSLLKFGYRHWKFLLELFEICKSIYFFLLRVLQLFEDK